MARFLTSLLLFVYSVAAFAADKADKADAPVEKADPIVVVGFLVLFFGSCIGYVGYLIYTKNKAAKEAAPDQHGKVDAT